MNKKKNIISGGWEKYLLIFLLVPLFSGCAVPEKNSAESGRVKLVFTGDIMTGRKVEEICRTKNDWNWPFLKVRNYFKSCDFVFGNLEGALTKNEDKTSGKDKKIWLKLPPESVLGLEYAGFNALGIANNHILDYGGKGLQDTLKDLDKTGIQHTGAAMEPEKAFNPVIFTKNSCKFAIFAFNDIGYDKWGIERKNSLVADCEDERASKLLRNAVQNGEIVIVNLHFGREYSKIQDERQEMIARKFIDAGASLVIGHHSHQIQPTERYKDGFIAYGLGNFLFDQDWNPEAMKGIILEMIVEDGKISGIKILETEISGEFQVFLNECPIQNPTSLFELPALPLWLRGTGRGADTEYPTEEGKE